MNRRQLVQLSGAALAVALAGCTGDDETNDDPVETNQGNNGIEDDNGEDADETPEEVVREFYEAMDRGESEAAQDQLHEEHNFPSIFDVLDSADQFELTIHEIETGSLSDAIEEHPWYSDEDEIQNEKEDMNDRLDDIGAEDYEVMFVSYTDDAGDGREDVYWVVVPDNGGYLLFWRYHVNV